MTKIILHIDMNSYFASVEQQANPFLRGKPVGVCAYLSPRGCIIASSREAKASGIKTGCTVGDALKFDPKVVLVENEPAKYRSTTERIFKILGEYTDKLEPYSIDEAFLDLAGWVKDFYEAEKIGLELAARIKDEVGEYLSASVGVSYTKFLAKFASDIGPKGGILIITPRKLEDCLSGRPLTDAWGIGAAMAERLNFLGINDLLELKKYSADKLRRALGRYGYYLWANMNGLEISSVSRGASPPKSIGHSYCLPKKTADKKYLSAVMFKLCEKTGRRLREQNLEAQQIRIYIVYARDGGLSKSFKTSGKMFTTEEIARQAAGFLESADLTMPVSMLAVSVSRLTPLSAQLSLFDQRSDRCFSGRTALKDLSRAIDRLNDKYGEYTVARGAMFGLESQARDRIGFRKTVKI
ncbi:MAG: DNA polymerase IV [bacterium]|nr:DNA polymerase IV [bacterium]